MDGTAAGAAGQQSLTPSEGRAPALDRERLGRRLEAAQRRRVEIEDFTDAAVLVPIIRRGERIVLGYTLRPDEMPTHAGQISFPGGRRDPDDADSVATALRELEEELGIDPEHVEVLGKIDDVPSPAGFVVTPVVGWLVDPPEVVLCEREVCEYFEVDIEELADPASFKDCGVREIRGISYPLPEFHVGDRRIWGVTARVTQRLLQVAELH